MDARARWIGAGLLVGIALASAAFVIVERTGGAPFGTSGSVDLDDDERLARIDARLREIEASMRAKPAEPRVRAAPPEASASADAAARDRDLAAERAATVAEVEEFLAQRLKDDDDRPAAAHRFELGVGDTGTTSLDDAAKQLNLRPEQVTRVRDAFRLEGEAQLRAAFGSDDIEAIRARIHDAQYDPAARSTLQDELLGNLLKSLPRIRRAEDEKVRTLKDTLGADGYDRFLRISVRESDVDEFDALFEQTFSDAAPQSR